MRHEQPPHARVFLSAAGNHRARTLYQAEGYALRHRPDTLSANLHRSDTDPSNNKRRIRKSRPSGFPVRRPSLARRTPHDGSQARHPEKCHRLYVGLARRASRSKSPDPLSRKATQSLCRLSAKHFAKRRNLLRRFMTSGCSISTRISHQNALSSGRFRKRSRLLGGFAGDTSFSAKADLGLFRAPAEIHPKNRPELQTHVKIRPVFLQNRPELQGRGKNRATITQTVQNSRAATDAAQPQTSEQNEAGTTKGCRPRFKPFAIAKSSTASHRPHAAEPCAGKRPGALTPQSRCGAGARRPGRRRSRRPHTSR